MPLLSPFPLLTLSEEIIARGLATYVDTHPQPLDELARQDRLTALYYANGAPFLPRDRSSTAEYDDAVSKLRPGVALSPPPPKKRQGEPVEDEESEMKVGRGLFANLRRLFWGQ